MSTEFSKDDKVQWESSQGTIEGTVEKKLTEPIDIKKHHVDASKDDPQYLVKRHMQKVVSYVRRHLAQRPQGDVQDTRWRFSLMNWGHDPLQED